MNNIRHDGMTGKSSASIWFLIALASIILTITMGIRQTVGLFVHPIVSATGIDIVEVSFAIAVGQLLWGVFQPVFGAMADRRGPFSVLVTGAVLLALGQIGTVWATSPWTLLLMFGFLAPAGAAAGSFSILIGSVAGVMPMRLRSMASGIINAGGSVGQFAFAPMVQAFIHLWGYASALVMLAVWALATIPLARLLCGPIRRKEIAPPTATETADKPASDSDGPGIGAVIRHALKDRSYLLLHAGFFTCGFHVAFLVTHLPGEVATCGHSDSVSAVSLSLIGLCNIAGSLGAGWLGNRFRMKYILAALYAARALMILAFVMSSKSELAFYIFSAATGFTWLATVPPTAGIVGKLFGVRYLATLFGLTLLTHQVGGFLGAWLGGVAVARYGDYQWVWYADIALALLAAFVNLPIREKAPR